MQRGYYSSLVVLALLLCALVCVSEVSAASYKPVVFVHGFTGTFHDWDDLVGWLATAHPGQRTFPTHVDAHIASVYPMHKLMEDTWTELSAIIANNSALFADGFHLVCHSQGGLICRSVFSAHKLQIENFLSLSGVQNGFYGYCEKQFPGNLTCEAVTKIMYTKALQDTFGVANYWRSPEHEEYLKGNLFLPLLDNETSSTNSPFRREFFLQPKKYYFFGSPDDEIIKPPLTSVWQYDNIPMHQQPVYVKDSFGLRQADEEGRVVTMTLPHIKHQQWITDFNIFTQYLAPILY